jgi:hypothetical protein
MADYPTMNPASAFIFVVRRSFFTVIIFCGATVCLYGQEFSLGVKAGPLTAWSVYGDKDDRKFFDSKPTIGFYAAGIIGFPLKKNYSCIIEGGFSQKGRSVLFNEGYGKNAATYSYTDAALLLRRSFNVTLGKNIPSKIFFNIGPHINYWLKGKGRIGTNDNDGTAYTVVFNQEADLGQFDKMYLNNVNRWLFGLDLGAGIIAPITNTQHLLVELRFTSGHTFYGDRNSATYSWVEFQDNLRANEKVLSLTAAYTFDFNIQEGRKGKSTKDKEVKRKPVNKTKKRKARPSIL